MNATDAIRYLAHQAKRCRHGDRDTAEAICLLFPAICEVLHLKPMDDFQSLEFHVALREELARVKAIPLVEANCQSCGNAEALREDLFAAGPARSFCDFCQREKDFARIELPTGQISEITYSEGNPSMKPMLIVLLFGALAVASAPAQTTNDAAALATALQLEASRGTNADGFCFLSIQHPEWPPMPASPDPSLELARVGPGIYLVDDAHWKYPAPPPAATNAAARQIIKSDGNFGLETNFLAANPIAIEMTRRFTISAFPTNNVGKIKAALTARRIAATMEVLDQIAAHPVSNELTLPAAMWLRLTNSRKATNVVKEVQP